MQTLFFCGRGRSKPIAGNSKPQLLMKGYYWLHESGRCRPSAPLGHVYYVKREIFSQFFKQNLFAFTYWKHLHRLPCKVTGFMVDTGARRRGWQRKGRFTGQIRSLNEPRRPRTIYHHTIKHFSPRYGEFRPLRKNGKVKKSKALGEPLLIRLKAVNRTAQNKI